MVDRSYIRALIFWLLISVWSWLQCGPQCGPVLLSGFPRCSAGGLWWKRCWQGLLILAGPPLLPLRMLDLQYLCWTLGLFTGEHRLRLPQCLQPFRQGYMGSSCPDPGITQPSLADSNHFCWPDVFQPTWCFPADLSETVMLNFITSSYCGLSHC